MIQAQAGQPFTAIISGAPTGLTGQITVRIVDPPDTIIVAATAAGIVESVGIPGAYSVTLTAPTPDVEPHTYWVVWHGPGFADLPEDVVVALADVHTGSSVVDPDSVLAAIESLMRARLIEGGNFSTGSGQRVAHFSAATIPTLDQALEVAIREAATAGREWSSAGSDDRDDLVTVAALRSAMELEGSSYPDQVESGRSPARFWRDLLNDRLKRLDKRFPPAPDADPDEPGSQSAMPLYAFPPAPPMVW